MSINVRIKQKVNGEYQTLHPETNSNLVIESSDKQFVSTTDKMLWNGKQDKINFIPEDTANKNKVNGYAGIGSDGKIDSSLLPSIAITDTHVVSSEAEMLTLTAQVGDIAIVNGEKTYILQKSGASTLSNWVEIKNKQIFDIPVTETAPTNGSMWFEIIS